MPSKPTPATSSATATGAAAAKAKAKSAPKPVQPGHVKALDKQTVHQICTNQVVVSLETCLKELLENSLDAGASKIEIVFGESGVSYLKIQDNGHGIREADLDGLCKRHHTSKLRKFEEIHGNLSTFGFRGEALAAVCALSGQFTVVTRHKDASCGVQAEWEIFLLVSAGRDHFYSHTR